MSTLNMNLHFLNYDLIDSNQGAVLLFDWTVALSKLADWFPCWLDLNEEVEEHLRLLYSINDLMLKHPFLQAFQIREMSNALMLYFWHRVFFITQGFDYLSCWMAKLNREGWK